MKNREIINKGLYFEALRRIRLPALIVTIILSLEAILVPIAMGVSDYVDRMNALENGYKYDSVAQSYSAAELHIMLFLLIFAAPIFAAGMFSFLNKRSSSDFYHSLPHRRSTFCLSSIAALVTWIFGITVVTSGLSRLFASFFPNVISVEPGTYLEYMLGCFAAAMLIAACVTLAMTITGNTLSNIIVTMMLLFFPRYVILFVVYAVAAKLPFIPMGYMHPLLSVGINIPAGLVLGTFTFYGDISACLFDTTSQIYTLVLAIIYFAAAVVLYCRRRSESAEHSAPSRMMQAVYRTVAAMAVSVPICFVIYSNGVSDGYELFVYCILYLIVALTYLLYELVTMKRWKNLVKIIPGLGVVAILNLAMYGAMFGITAVERGFSPEADEIDYFQVLSSDGDEWVYDFKGYAVRETSYIKVEDAEAIKVVAEALERTIENGGEMYVYDYYYTEDTIGSTSYVEYHPFTVKIKAGLTAKYRNIYITDEEENIIRDALAETDKYAKIWQSLPQPQRGTLNVDGDSFTLEGEAATAIFEVMKREVASLEFADWYDYVNAPETACGYLNYVSSGTDIYVPFNNELLPKTTKAFYEALNADKDIYDPEEFLERLNSWDKDTERYHVELNLFVNGAYDCYYAEYDDVNNEEAIAALAEAIDTETALEYGDTYVYISLSKDVVEDGAIVGSEYSDTIAKIKMESFGKLVKALGIKGIVIAE